MSKWQECAYCNSTTAITKKNHDGESEFYCTKCKRLFFGETEMKTCEDCEHFGGYTGEYMAGCKGYLCVTPFSVNNFCFVKNTCKYYERKTMNIKEAYQVLQAAWVELYNVEVGDTVKTLREMRTTELGCDGWASYHLAGIEAVIVAIAPNYIEICPGGYWPFFCLEFVKKAEPKIEITVKVNHKEVPLSTLSEETVLNIRRES